MHLPPGSHHMQRPPSDPPASPRGGLLVSARGPGYGQTPEQKQRILDRMFAIERELSDLTPASGTSSGGFWTKFKKFFSSGRATVSTSTGTHPDALRQQLQSLLHEYEFLHGQCDFEMLRTLEEPQLVQIRDEIFQAVSQTLSASNSGTPDLAPDQAAITSFYSHLDGLTLTHDEKQKLKEMMTDANYQKAVEAAQELHKDCKVPTKEYIIAELKKLSVSQLKNICEMQEKPTLLIVPPASFADKVKAMNEHKHYPNQGNTYVYEDKNSPYKNAPTMTTGRISIVDGTIHPKPPQSGVSTELKFRRDHYDSLFMSKNLGHIDKDEYAVLMQISLIEAEKTGNTSLIIDNWEARSGTISFIDPTTLTSTGFAACANFYSGSRQVSFDAADPAYDFDALRGRSSVQVCTFPA